MVFITNNEYKELLEIKFKYELAHETTDVEKDVENNEIAEEVCKFKVGDKVEVTTLTDGYGVIERIKESRALIHFNMLYGDTYYNLDDLKLIEREDK